MAQVESAWGRYPNYRIDLIPWRGRARAWHGDLLLAESDSCLVVEETDHVSRLYFPIRDVHLDLFERTDLHTICPFKGEADYWSLSATEPPLENVVWAYPTPFTEVAGISDHVCFYEDRVRVELLEVWTGDDPGSAVASRFPIWGDASDLVRLLDVQPGDDGHYTSTPYPTSRNVVEGSHMLGQSIVAASKAVPGQRVTSAYMTYPRAAAFDTPLDLAVDVLRRGRTFSSVSVRVEQAGSLRAPGLLLMDAGAPDLFRMEPEMPKVPGPDDCPPHDFRMTGRDVRVVDGAYSPDPERVGPPELFVWVRYRDDPGEQYLRDALVAQAMGHWTIAAAMLPHRGFGEADAHVSLSTAIMSISVAFHDPAPLNEWYLYANPAIHAGAGLAQGEGRVFSQDGRLMASYTVQAMIRAFNRDPESMGLDASTAL